jgi:hypothetical protein
VRIRAIVASGVLATTLIGCGIARAAGSDAAQPAPDPVVLVGIAGLQWSDLSPQSTPTLWRLTGQGDTASMTVRTVRSFTCPVDGWLTVSAGRRAAAPAPDDEACAPIPVPQPEPAGAGVQIPGWDEVVAENAGGIYDARPGLLGDTLAAAGICATAVGPGAALAVADGSGRVSSYLGDLGDIGDADRPACPLTVIDVGTAGDLGQVDSRLAELTASLPDRATMLVAGISDRDDPRLEGAPRPHLRVALTYDSDDAAPRWLTSQSTRRQALVQLTDIAPTVYDRLGVDKPPSAVGQPWRPGDVRPSDTADATDR